MLSQEDRDRVRKTVDAAEKGLAAEIVPCVFAQSSPYPETVWAGAAAGAALACGALLVTDLTNPLWWPLGALMSAVSASGILGAGLGRGCGPVKRFFIGAHHMDDAVQRRAKEIFYDRGIASTKSRDGVLIFASVLERRVVVLADEAVRAKVKPDAWKPVIETLSAAAADGRFADGLVGAVEKAAVVLRAAGVTGEHGRELSDEPVEGDTR